MKPRTVTMFAVLMTMIGVVLLLPKAALAGCSIADPGCYIDDFTHKQLYQFDLSVWQLNRAGLVLARWLEDLRAWLTDSVFADAFTTLTQPVKFAFYLTLIVAWLIFIISFMIQSFIDLRWVDLRRATRPILLAVFIFSFGGSMLKGTEYVRLLGGTILQQAATTAVLTVKAPPVPTANTGDMADASTSIYTTSTSCGTPARAQTAMFLNDYDARYLWSNADDIHCADTMALSSEFYHTYFPYGQDATDQDSNLRQQAVARAAQGGLRQATGVFMTAGAIIEQLVQLIFAVALAMVWFGILLSLVFAVFVPTEELFSGQIKALLSVLRASWLASFLIGLGLAVLKIVAESGNGFLVFICGLVLIAVAIWQGKQALETMSTALAAVSAATGSAPQAVGGMLKGWGTTAAMVAGVAMTGGMGAMVGSVGSNMARRAGRNVGTNPLSQAAGRVLTNRVADRIDTFTRDQQILGDARLATGEAAWYERQTTTESTTPKAATDTTTRMSPTSPVAAAPATTAHATQAATARTRATAGQAEVLDRRADRARRKGQFAAADSLRAQAAQLRVGTGAAAEAPDTDRTQPLDAADMDRALEQLQEAHDDPEAQRRVLTEATRRAQLGGVRKAVLRDTRPGDATAATAALPAPVVSQSASLTRPATGLRVVRSSMKERRALDREIAALVAQIDTLEQPEASAPIEDASADASRQLAALRTRLTTAQERRAALRPASQTARMAVMAPGDPLTDAPNTVALVQLVSQAQSDVTPTVVHPPTQIGTNAPSQTNQTIPNAPSQTNQPAISAPLLIVGANQTIPSTPSRQNQPAISVPRSSDQTPASGLGAAPGAVSAAVRPIAPVSGSTSQPAIAPMTLDAAPIPTVAAVLPAPPAVSPVSVAPVAAAAGGSVMDASAAPVAGSVIAASAAPVAAAAAAVAPTAPVAAVAPVAPATSNLPTGAAAPAPVVAPAPAAGDSQRGIAPSQAARGIILPTVAEVRVPAVGVAVPVAPVASVRQPWKRTQGDQS